MVLGTRFPIPDSRSRIPPLVLRCACSVWIGLCCRLLRRPMAGDWGLRRLPVSGVGYRVSGVGRVGDPIPEPRIYVPTNCTIIFTSLSILKGFLTNSSAPLASRSSIWFFTRNSPGACDAVRVRAGEARSRAPCGDPVRAARVLAGGAPPSARPPPSTVRCSGPFFPGPDVRRADFVQSPGP